jgi:hypothetical protein
MATSTVALTGNLLSNQLTSNPTRPLPPALMSTALTATSSVLTATASPSVNTSAAQNAAIASALSNVAGQLSRGSLNGVLPGQAPVVVSSPTIALAAQRSTAESVNSNTSFGVPVSGNVTAGGVNLPAGVLADNFKGNASAIPAVRLFLFLTFF